MKPKYGIVGCGGIARFHFNGLEKAGAEVVHIADLSPEAAKSYVDRFDARYSENYADLLADPEVTAVSVLTNSGYHREICLAALASGKDIICEKTMTNDVDEATKLVRAVQTSDRLFFTAYMKRFFPASQKLRELLPSLGQLFSAQVRTYQPWGDLYSPGANPPGWAIEKYGGAVMKCAASHLLDLTLSLLDRPQRLYAHVDYVPDTRFDRKATALLEYDTGLVVSFESATHPLKKIGYERNGWDEFVQINGVDGRLDLSIVMWDHPENNASLLTHYDNRTGTSTEFRFDALNSFDVEIAHFDACLEKREQGSPNVVDGFNVDYLIENMARSSREKTAIQLDWCGF